MNTTVNYDTALALKAAGFDQPEKEHGQIWLDRRGGDWIIGCYPTKDVLRAVEVDGTRWEFLHDTNGFVFAPTATDILAVFPGATLSKISGSGWVCKYPITSMYDDEHFSDCPHTACAEGWMAWKSSLAR